MIVTTVHTLADQDIVQTLGTVRGAATWTRRISKYYSGGLRGIRETTTLDLGDAIAQAKEQALADMKKEAARAGANAIVGLQETVAEVTAGTIMVTVMGTAVHTTAKRAGAPVPAPAAATAGWQAAYAELLSAQPQPSVLHH